MFQGVIGDGSDERTLLGELVEASKAAFEADRRIFAEMRSAVRAYVGQFGADMGSVDDVRREGGRGIAPPASREKGRSFLRYAKNHIPRLADVYSNEILREAPDVAVVPVTGGEVRAAPLARMNNDVWEHHKKKTAANYRQVVDDRVLDFVVTGEVAVKLYWDEEKDCVHEEKISPFDLARAPGSQSVEESPWHVFRRVYTRRQLIRIYGPKLAAAISQPGSAPATTWLGESSHTVFQSSRYEYSNLEGAMVMEYYERPTATHPKGRYFYFTEGRLLEKGELPGGVYPIVVQRFLKTPGLARGHSFIRNVYRIQTEINRASGQDATNMTHFGDDKFVTNASSDIQIGQVVKGATHLKVSSYGDLQSSFMHVEGKGMPKYVDYVRAQVKEMDYICHVATQMEEKKGPQKGGDLSVVLYTQIKDKKRFVKYAQGFEDFTVTLARSVLELYRHYLMSSDVIHSGNRDEMVLVDDFKETSDLDYMFKVAPANESDETRLGKQIAVDKLLQYAGRDLDKTDIGMVLRSSTLSDNQGLMDHFSASYDSLVNNLIEIEKGILPVVSDTEDFAYKSRMVTARMNRPDFKHLPGLVQELYQRFLKICEEGVAKAENERLRIEKGVVPTDGALINTDMYRTVPNSSGTGMKTEKVKIPQAALEWLTKALEKQGATQENLAGLPAPVQGNIMDGVRTAAEQLGVPGGGGGEPAALPAPPPGGVAA